MNGFLGDSRDHTPQVARDAPSEPDLVPGQLQGTATLTLQTQQAARLVRGRAQAADKPAIVGLLAFAAMCRTIWHGVRADDPYADWWRLKVDGAIRHARAVLEEALRELDALPDGGPALTVAPARSTRPVRIRLNFTNPDAFRAAQIIGHFDGFVCRVLASSHIGALSRDDAHSRLEWTGRAVRRLLLSAVGYRYTGVTRRDFREGTALAIRTREAMGACPPALIDKAYTHAVMMPPPPGTSLADANDPVGDAHGAVTPVEVVAISDSIAAVSPNGAGDAR